MNRGIARRTLFESAQDIRFFLSRLALAVRRGELRIHCWSVLTTHFHLLVESPHGQLSAAMQRVQLDYVRHFNRRRRRDGPLVRGRFRSKRVDTLTYRRMLVAYIDDNPRAAGLCWRPEDYLFGSARHYARTVRPPWLERGWVESEVKQLSGLTTYDPSWYRNAFDRGTREGRRYLVEARVRRPQLDSDPLDDLIDAAQPTVLEWMRRKAKLADGTVAGLAVVDPVSIEAAISEGRKRDGDWAVELGRKHLEGWKILHVALLRDLAGLPFLEAGGVCGESQANARLLYGKHRACVVSSAEYGERAAYTARRAIQICHGARG